MTATPRAIERTQDAFDEVMLAIQEGTITREFGDRLLGHIAAIRSAMGFDWTPRIRVCIGSHHVPGCSHVGSSLDTPGGRIEVPEPVDDVGAVEFQKRVVQDWEDRRRAEVLRAIEATAAPDAIDVERLTKALRATGALWSQNDYYEVTTDAEKFAVAIAREYVGAKWRTSPPPTYTVVATLQSKDHPPSDAHLRGRRSGEARKPWRTVDRVALADAEANPPADPTE